MRKLLIALVIALTFQPSADASVISVIKKAGGKTKDFLVKQVKALPDEIASGVVGAIISASVAPIVVPLVLLSTRPEKPEE